MKLLGLIGILAALALGVCPTPESCDVPFQHDPNMINYRVVKVHTMRVFQTYIYDFNSCDPDDDNTEPLFHELLGGPAGISCSPEGKVTFTPLEVGIFFGDFAVTDSPLDDTPDTDSGTIVFRVLPKNRPPVLGGCSQ